MDDIKDILLKRRERHEELNEQDRIIIINNIDFPNIVNERVILINSRLAKIEEIDTILKLIK